MAVKGTKIAKKTSRRASTEKPVIRCGNPSGKRPIREASVAIVDEKALSLCVGKIRLAVEHQMPSLAQAALAQFLQETGVCGSITKESPISWLQTESRPSGSEGLDVREINMLEREGFLNVGAFIDADIRDLESIDYFGVGTIERMQRIRSSVRRELSGLSAKRVTRREAIDKALRGDMN